MQILLANAKIMYEKAEKAPRSTPLFQSITNVLAEEMARMDVEDLGKQLDCSKKIAAENWKRYQNFGFAEKLPAIMAYNGQAYKHLKAHTLSEEALSYAQKHSMDYLFSVWTATPYGWHCALQNGTLHHIRGYTR